jgi:hypothetical protein
MSSDPSLVPLVKRTRTRPDGRDSPTNARASAAADPEPSPTELQGNMQLRNVRFIVRKSPVIQIVFISKVSKFVVACHPAELRHSLAENAAAAALLTAAIAAAAAKCDDPWVLHTVLVAAAATANAWHIQVHRTKCRHTDDEEDHPDDSDDCEPRSPAPPKPEAHWHSAKSGAKGHMQSHNASQSDSPA